MEQAGTIHWEMLAMLIGQTVYFVSAIALNLFLFMIGNFYRKKLEQKILLWGFFIAMISLVSALIGSFLFNGQSELYIIAFSMIVAGGATIINGGFLYYAMKQSHK